MHLLFKVLDAFSAIFLPPLPQILQQPNVPAYLIYSSTAVLIGYYILDTLILPHDRTRRSKSWTLSVMVSLIMTLLSIPCIFQYLIYGFTTVAPNEFHLFMCCFFIAFVVWDLLLGLFLYRDELDLLVAWIHHLGYFSLLVNLIYYNAMHPFCVASIMELPTFILALGHVWPQFRQNIGFGMSFFVTRIVFHLYLIVQMYIYYTPYWWMVMAGIFPLHAFWFTNWCTWYCNQGKIHFE